jgi:hypothetical protein
VEPLPDRGRQFIEAPEEYQVDALIRPLDDTLPVADRSRGIK